MADEKPQPKGIFPLSRYVTVLADPDTVTFRRAGNNMTLSVNEWKDLYYKHRTINDSVEYRWRNPNREVHDADEVAKAIVQMAQQATQRKVPVIQLLWAVLEKHWRAEPLGLDKEIRVRFYDEDTQVQFFKFSNLVTELFVLSHDEWREFHRNITAIHDVVVPNHFDTPYHYRPDPNHIGP